MTQCLSTSFLSNYDIGTIMTFTREYLENAKQKANKRLTGWIEEAKEATGNRPPVVGIARLQLKYSGVFKRIQWKPRPLNQSTERMLDNLGENVIYPYGNDASTKEYEKTRFVSHRGPASIPQIHVHIEDQRAQDSNSSNLSSSLGQRDEIGKKSGHTTSFSQTPIIRTPFSQEEITEDESNLVINNQPTPDIISSAENTELLKYSRERRAPIVEYDKGTVIEFDKTFQPLFKRRKRKKTKKSTQKNGHVVTEVENITEEGNNHLSVVQKKSSFFISEGPRPRSAKSSLAIKLNVGRKGNTGVPIELVFRRTSRAIKSLKTMQSIDQESYTVQQTREPTTAGRRQEVLDHFRRIVRLLIHVRVLLNVSRVRIEEEEKSKEFKRIDGETELSFDLSMYKAAFSCGALSTRLRRSLKKNPEDRNEDDAKMLMEVMLRLPVFMKYPTRVKQWLAKQMWYDCFNNGRVIVKQGDPGSRMYFVVSGEVDLKRTDTAASGEESSYHLKTLKAGATFGEISLIRDMRREFTAVCKGTSELLSLSKSEFNNALRDRWEQECNIRYEFLRSCDIFDQWTEKQLQSCADASELKEYKDNKVIMGDTDKLTESVYMIQKGRCDVVRRIVVTRHQSPYLRPELYLTDASKRHKEYIEKPYGKSRRIHKKEVHFLTVTTLHPGSYFGAGENLRDTFILSRGKTECVVLNSAQFSIQGKSEQLRTMASKREEVLPSNKSLYKQFQVNRRWYEYRNNILREIYSRKKMASGSTYTDVPRTIMNEPRIPDDLINYKR